MVSFISLKLVSASVAVALMAKATSKVGTFRISLKRHLTQIMEKHEITAILI